MDIFFVPFLVVVGKIIEFYQLFLVVYVVLGWLETFQIVNRYNRVVYAAHMFLFRLFEPILAPIRRTLPQSGNVDFSPLIVFFILYFLLGVLGKVIQKFPA